MLALVGLINIAGHANPTKELLWLFSVSVGIIMCKIVYDLTGAISPFLFKGFVKLDDKTRLEWNNRGFSTFHALIVVAASLYLLVGSDLFHDSSRDELVINRTSAFSDTVLGISTGYFLTDLAMIIYYFPALGGLEYVLHHGLSMLSIVQSLVSGQGLIYILMVLFSECTTPFVNLRWYLDVAGQKSSRFYLFNGVALFLGWLVARIVLFIYFFYHMFTHFDQVKQVYPMGFYTLLAVPPVLTMMNLFWFTKIAKGMVKTLVKSWHRR
nr:transmembrane protein 56-B isoform X1 [Ipomoea trifida]